MQSTALEHMIRFNTQRQFQKQAPDQHWKMHELPIPVLPALHAAAALSCSYTHLSNARPSLHPSLRKKRENSTLISAFTSDPHSAGAKAMPFAIPHLLKHSVGIHPAYVRRSTHFHHTNADDHMGNESKPEQIPHLHRARLLRAEPHCCVHVTGCWQEAVLLIEGVELLPLSPRHQNTAGTMRALLLSGCFVGWLFFFPPFFFFLPPPKPKLPFHTHTDFIHMQMQMYRFLWGGRRTRSEEELFPCFLLLKEDKDQGEDIHTLLWQKSQCSITSY